MVRLDLGKIRIECALLPRHIPLMVASQAMDPNSLSLDLQLALDNLLSMADDHLLQTNKANYFFMTLNLSYLK